MRTQQTKILAIDPGTKEIGTAVLSAGELLYYGVKTIRSRRSPLDILAQTRRMVLRLITDYGPQYLAIEKMFLVQKSASMLIVVADEIKAIAREQGLLVYEYAPTLVRKLICQTGKATKAETASQVALQYPELGRYLGRRTKWETLYYANMFDAVAVGLCCYREISRTEPHDPQSSPPGN
jgi:Holliday junction resolvasome RuvABC endonuclease subunit